MWSRGIVFLIGAVFVSAQIAEDIYVAELMVESNVTLDAQTILSILNSTTTLYVLDINNQSKTVTFQLIETVAECLIIGSETNCNCSQGYIWSNEVCSSYNCCRELTCTQNVSYISPLCVQKVPVYINGSANLSSGTWDSTKTNTLVAAFGGLNGFEYLNITGQRNTIADFEVKVSVVFTTSRLQSILDSLNSSLPAFVLVDTTGIVHIEAPQNKVCYQSTPVLSCTFQEAFDSSGWNKSTAYDRFVLNIGSVVQLENCNPPEPPCLRLRLEKVTSAWEGIYECGFTKGLVRHTAKALLQVARLPDDILMKIDPLTGDCSNKQSSESITVNVSATILNYNATYNVTWSYNNALPTTGLPTISGTNLIYNYPAQISCTQTTNAQTVIVTFENDMQQKKTANVTIPVIYANGKFCKEEIQNGDVWPKTPSGDTAVNKTCSKDRVGYKARTCSGETWQNVTTFCVSAALNKILNAAESFLQGLGATPEVALDIFNGLQNNTSINTSSSDSVADIAASINVLDKMAQASENIVLGAKILPPFVNAASNLLNKTWNPGNDSLLYKMSANYLQSLEGLVKNIQINTSGNSSDYYTPNLDLKYCTGSNCAVEVFGIDVNLTMPSGIMKTVAVKNLMDKLKNTFKATEKTSLLVSTTLENNSDSSIVIEMQFSTAVAKNQTPYCVFWETSKGDWSDEGCNKTSNDENGTICRCTHLTSFSVLMARGSEVSRPDLDIITYIGLGVSICSLVIFLLIEFLVWSAVIKTKLSHYRHTAMVNIAFFLLLADISFLASSKPKILSNTMCLAFTISKHLFFLVMFSWMLCLSVMLVHQLIFVFSPLRKKVFFFPLQHRGLHFSNYHRGGQLRLLQVLWPILL